MELSLASRDHELNSSILFASKLGAIVGDRHTLAKALGNQATCRYALPDYGRFITTKFQ